MDPKNFFAELKRRNLIPSGPTSREEEIEITKSGGNRHAHIH